MSRIGSLRLAAPSSSASFEMQLRLPAMFQVSVSWVEIPFIGGSIRITNGIVVLRTRFTREEKVWRSIFVGRKRPKTSRIPNEFTKSCFHLFLLVMKEESFENAKQESDHGTK